MQAGARARARAPASKRCRRWPGHYDRWRSLPQRDLIHVCCVGSDPTGSDPRPFPYHSCCFPATKQHSRVSDKAAACASILPQGISPYNYHHHGIHWRPPPRQPLFFLRLRESLQLALILPLMMRGLYDWEARFYSERRRRFPKIHSIQVELPYLDET